MSSIRNVHGVFNARKGIYDGKECVFTHRNPANGDLWSDDIPVKGTNGLYGRWVSPDSVQFI